MACSTGGRAACTAAHKNMQDRFCVSHTPLSPCEDEGELRYNQQVCGPPYRDVPGGLTGPGTHAP